jgi:IS30 family transposase
VRQISHESIYRFIRRDKKRGGHLFRLLRQPRRWRKHHSGADKRGRLPGKRHISERPAAVELRHQIGHWEMDTIVSPADRHRVVTLVERVTGCVHSASFTPAPSPPRTAASSSWSAPIGTCSNPSPSTMEPSSAAIATSSATGTTFYFCHPYHSWERGTNENTNGLVRKYIPKRASMKHLSQARCTELAFRLNNRPRKRRDYLSPP